MRRSTVTGMIVSSLVLVTTTAWFLNGKDVASTGWNTLPESLRSVVWPEPRELADFELATHTGSTFTEDSFAGQWDLVFFGYIDCPDICPMSLGAMQPPLVPERMAEIFEKIAGSFPDY